MEVSASWTLMISKVLSEALSPAVQEAHNQSIPGWLPSSDLFILSPNMEAILLLLIPNYRLAIDSRSHFEKHSRAPGVSTSVLRLASTTLVAGLWRSLWILLSHTIKWANKSCPILFTFNWTTVPSCLQRQFVKGPSHSNCSYGLHVSPFLPLFCSYHWSPLLSIPSLTGIFNALLFLFPAHSLLPLAAQNLLLLHLGNYHGLTHLPPWTRHAPSHSCQG